VQTIMKTKVKVELFIEWRG